MYADLIAQCVYSAFIFAYPNSWVSFDEDFKSEICLYINLWQVGTKPVPNAWAKWELRLLEPIDLPKCKANEDEMGVKSAGSFDFDTLLKEARRKVAAEEYQRKLKLVQQSFDKRFSIMEVKSALSRSRSKQHSADFKKRAARRSSTGMQTLSPDNDKLGAAIEQLTALEKEFYIQGPSAGTFRASVSIQLTNEPSVTVGVAYGSGRFRRGRLAKSNSDTSRKKTRKFECTIQTAAAEESKLTEAMCRA